MVEPVRRYGLAVLGDDGDLGEVLSEDKRVDRHEVRRDERQLGWVCLHLPIRFEQGRV